MTPITSYAQKGTNNGKNTNYEKMKLDRPFTKQSVRSIFSSASSYQKDELIITFRAGTTEAEKQNLLKKHNLKEINQMKNDQFVLVETKNQDLQNVARQLVQSNKVEYVEPNTKVKRKFVPRETYYSKQWHLPKIDAPKAWDVSKGNAGVIVAVIDGGAQKDHPDLKQNIVSPYNMVNKSTNYVPDDHGTHVAGIIASALNDRGTIGVAPNTKIMPINVFKGEEADMFTVSKAIEYATNKGADIINLSLGGASYSSAVDYAVQYASSKGLTIVAASGNEKSSKNTYPAAYKNVIGVSATNTKDQLASFSNYGKYIDVAAPGENIVSTGARSDFIIMNGTSMSAPIVSGVAALILAQNPFLKGAEVEKIIKNSSVDIGKKGWDIHFGYGKVNAYKALQLTKSPFSNVKVAPQFTLTGNNSTAITFTAPNGLYVSASVKDSAGKVVKKLYSSKSVGKPVTVNWNGKLDNGSYANSGQYNIVLAVSNTRASYQKPYAMKVQNNLNGIGTPEVQNPEVVSFYPGEDEAAIVSYYVGQPSKVKVEVLNKRNEVVRLLKDQESVGKGIHSFVWDGKNNQGILEKESEYKYRITVTNSGGGVRTVEGQISSTLNPPWLKENLYEHITSPSEAINFHINVTKKANMYLYVYDGDKEIDKKKFALKGGKETIQYKKPTNNSLYYVIAFEDELGNLYFYDAEG